MKASSSITHDQILLALNSEISARPFSDAIRVLDMGCGDGQLLSFLHQALRELHPEKTIELYGFDVSDSNVQASGFLERAIAWIQKDCAEVPWRDRIRMIRSTDPWPYEDGSFDFVVSNQVMEHVHDHLTALTQMRRVLKDGGQSFHLFPLKHYWYEGHLLIPFVHWISNHDLLIRYIRAWSALGVGKYRAHHLADPARVTLDVYAEEHADYMSFFTNYLTKRQLLVLAKSSGLRCTFRYSEWFYINKLRTMMGLPVRHVAKAHVTGFWHAVMMFFLMRVSGVTVALEHKQTYSR